MSDPSYLEVTPSLRIPMAELEYRASRSGGPGGQHVNTSSTRVEVWWDVAGAPSLSEEQRATAAGETRHPPRFVGPVATRVGRVAQSASQP